MRNKILIALCLLAIALPTYGATIYLDGTLGGNCTGNYSIAARACSGTDGNAYNTLAGANAALAGGDTLYIRAGTYYRAGANTYTGALNVAHAQSGSSGTHTIVSAYNSEEVIIGTAADKLDYPPSPYSSDYYASPAVTVKAHYVDIIGLKTFGQLMVIGADEGGIDNVLIDGCDVGGGGPWNNQAFALQIHTAYAVTVQNCKIHNSGASDSSGAPGLGGYAFSGIIRNNHFYDNYVADISVKDTSNQTGRNVEIYNNLFTESSIAPGHDYGIRTLTQAPAINNILIHNNVFINKEVGILPGLNPTGDMIFYNNTFVNCTSDIYFWSDSSSGDYIARNNLHYHTTGTNHVNMAAETNMDSDYNCFYASGVSPYWRASGVNTTTFATWQAAHDAHSVNGVDPSFINASGTTADDFKRSSYPNDVAEGSDYGRICGAYVDGTEIIGIGGAGEDTTNPTIYRITSSKANGSYTVGEVIPIEVTADESVTSTGNVTVTCETGDTDRTCTFTMTATNTGGCNITIGAGDTSADLNCTVSGTIADLSENSMTDFTPEAANVMSALKAIVIDTTAPAVSAFTVPETSGLQITIAEGAFTCTGTPTGYLITESAEAPLPSAAGWRSSAPTTYATTAGEKTLRAWCKDLAGNVSTAATDTVTVSGGVTYFPCIISP